MAKIRQRTWRVRGQRTKRKAWGFVTVENGNAVRCFKTEWTQEAAEKAWAARLLKSDQEPKVKAAGLTLAQAAERYLATKARKRSLAKDRRTLEHFKSMFGADTALADITASRISEYKAQRLAATSVKDAQGKGTLLSAAAVNRPLALLRHLLRLAHEEWEVLPAVPRIKLEKEPEGRIRWLGGQAPDEEARLLAACAKSKNPELVKKVTIALESGLRKGELDGLDWQHNIDMSRGVIRLEGRARPDARGTKSGKRREVPMRQAVYNILASLPEPHQSPVWKRGDVRTAFENAVEEAQLDDFHFHDCRHHFASWFVMRGGSLQALQKILGHATLAMTQRYAHLSPDYLRSEVAKTERRPEPAAQIAHAIAHGPVEVVVVPRKC